MGNRPGPGRHMPIPKDIRLATGEEKVEIYAQIHTHWRAGKAVTLKEHESGFPAVTVDCEDIHILTDILSIELWWAIKDPWGG